MKSKWARLGICILVGAALWLLPVPQGVKVQAWHLLAIFCATILGFILQPFSIGVLTFMGLTASMLGRVLKPSEAMSGFSSGVVWLIVAAFMFSRGFVKSGLGQRIAYLLMKRFGDSSLKLGYTLVFTNLLVSPAIPSNTARAGGIFFPIVRSLAEVFDSRPGPTSRKIGAFLIQVVYQGDNIACPITLTAMAGNVLMVTFAAKVVGVTLTWGLWAMAAIVPGIAASIVIPYFIYKYYPPEMTKTPEAKPAAIAALAQMGPMKIEEKVLTGVFIAAILGWATSQFTGLDATVVAMVAVCIMLLTSVLTWEDIVSERPAWDAFIWMGGIYGLADCLAKFGLFSALAQKVTSSLRGVPWMVAMVVITLIYVYSTYAFASGVAHIAAMYPVFLSVAVTAGAPPVLAALWLAFCSGLYQGLTHYASGPSAIFFAGGYVDQGTWWRIGFLVMLLNLIIWGMIGSLWWKVLGLW